jgi:glycerate kinase
LENSFATALRDQARFRIRHTEYFEWLTLGASIFRRPGANIVTEAIELDRKLVGCGLVNTGEGRLDGQTACGKAPVGVAKVARKIGIPVIATCGSLSGDADRVRAIGINAFFLSWKNRFQRRIILNGNLECSNDAPNKSDV